MVSKIIPLLLLLQLPSPNHFMSLKLSSVIILSTGAKVKLKSTQQLALVSVICFVLSLIVSASSTEWSPRHVDTKMGVVQGFVFYPNGFDGVEVFLNMPYASPPVANLRFMPPVTGSPWSGVRKSEQPSPVCPQVLPDIRNESEALKSMPKGRLNQLKRLLPLLRNQSEDCLYLNLYIPLSVAEERVKEKLPVLVFVIQEDYGYGAGHPYDPSMLVSYGNIIAVTLNYRVGILGFLNANSDSHFRLPYNFAMLDQIAALQWIQENIALFGGDRNNVTLLGYGKGAVLVNFLMISSAVPTGLLFHRVILSSGSALSPLSSDLSSGPELSKRFAKRVRCPPEPSSTMLECLREVPVQLFLNSELWTLFGPSGDGIVVKNELPPDNVIMNKISQYPLLFGLVRSETFPSLSNHDATYGMENERRRELLRQFINTHYRFHRSEILASAMFEYTAWERPVQQPVNVRDSTLDALADGQVVAPITKLGDLHSQTLRSRAYFYVFEYQSKSSDYQQKVGCLPLEDLGYVFGVPLYFYDNDSSDSGSGMRSDISEGDYLSQPITFHNQPPKEKVKRKQGLREAGGFATGNFTLAEMQLSVTIMRLWANFVKMGNPNGDLKSSGHHKHGGRGESLGRTSSGSVRGGLDFVDSGESVVYSETNGLGREKFRKEGILVEWWPQYESLDKKYLHILDPLSPRVKSFYRSHKLSFWNNLVPDYQKNEEGTVVGSSHHGIAFTNSSNNNKNIINSDPHSQSSLENLSKVSVIPSPTVFASGLYDLSQGSPPRQGHNSSNSNSPKLSQGPLPKGTSDQQGPKEEQHDSGENRISNSDDDDGEDSIFGSGFQAYSTALSVTIAIGCSLLILNILIFATFYYEREKRLNASRRELSNSAPRASTSSQSRHQQVPPQEHPLFSQHDQSDTTPKGLRHQGSSLTIRSSNSGTLRTLKRRKENGGVGVAGFDSFMMDMEKVNEGRVRDCGGGGSESVCGIGASCRTATTSSTFGFRDLHLSTYEEEAVGECLHLGPVTSGSTEEGVNYGNYPIKRYAEIGCSTTNTRNRSRRAINELGMSIDMSESVTNDPNFSAGRCDGLEIGTTFVGIEDCYQGQAQTRLCHFTSPHLQHLRTDNSNSSFEDSGSAQ